MYGTNFSPEVSTGSFIIFLMFLDFERELAELHQKINQLKRLYQLGEKEKEKELRKLQREFRKKAKGDILQA